MTSRLAFALVLGALLALGSSPAQPGDSTTPDVATAPDARLRTLDGSRDLDMPYRVWRVPMEKREIALTFDDGPYPFYTPLLLHELQRSGVPATFFLVGRNAQEFPSLVDRIVDGGFEIGNHTFNHYRLDVLSADEIRYQIAEDDRVLRQFTGRPLTLFRPPHGRADTRVIDIARSLGYRTIFWSDAPEDVKNISPDLEVQRVLKQASPGGIVLLHSGEYKTIEALPVIIARLRERGYTFVTVTQLMQDGDASHDIGPPVDVPPTDTTP